MNGTMPTPQNTLTNLLFQGTPDTGNGTPRVDRITNEDPGNVIQQAGQSVLDALTGAAAKIFLSTDVGQRFQRQAQQQVLTDYWTRWGPLVMVGLIVVILFTVIGRR